MAGRAISQDIKGGYRMFTGMKLTNEELVLSYRNTRDEGYLAELMRQNKGLLYMLVEPFVHSIPNSELEDLTSEAYIPMLKAIEDFDEARGLTFANLLKVRLPERNALQDLPLLAMRALQRLTVRADLRGIPPLL